MIVVFQEKGGVGKTNIAFSIAKDLSAPYITNDSSIVSSVYDDARFIDKKMPLEPGTIYDLGGFVTRYVSDVLDAARIVIVPVIADYNSLLKAIRVIDHVGTDRCIVVANMIKKPMQLKEIEEFMQDKYPDVKIISLKESAIFRNALENGFSPTEVYNQNNLSKHTYKSVIEQYNILLKEVKQ